MKVAIVHDYIKEYGGAERVLEALHKIYPGAPVYTTVYLPKFLGPHRERFKNWEINTSWFQDIPFKGKLISPLRLLTPFIFQSLDLSKFDVIIVSQTGAYFPNLVKKGKAILICYTHTPPRYLYGYATARDWKKNTFMRVLGELSNHILRMVDYNSSKNVDFFIANSKNIASRIKKFYRRDSVVIYPPVNIQDTKIQRYEDSEKKSPNILISQYPNYFLAGGRIARPKHIDLIIKTFMELKLPLKVFGKEFAGALNISISKYPNIQMLGEVTDKQKFNLMAGAKAYVFASEDEDFGITPVEAMSLGTPVIAYKSGGVLETLQEGKTGIFFDKLSVNSLKNAILRYNLMHFDTGTIIEHSKKFSEENFKNKIKEFVQLKAK